MATTAGRGGRGRAGGRHVPPSTSVQRGGAGYYSAGGTRTVSTPGGRQASAGGGSLRLRTAGGQQVAVAAPERAYHRVILAEFLTCVVLIAAAPFLDQGKDKGSPASLAMPLVRLTAVAIVFFVLALMGSSARAGKAAAAFGGLVTLGVLLNSAGTVGGLTAAFGPARAAAAGQDGGTRPGTDSASIAEPAPPGDTASIGEP